MEIRRGHRYGTDQFSSRQIVQTANQKSQPHHVLDRATKLPITSGIRAWAPAEYDKIQATAPVPESDCMTPAWLVTKYHDICQAATEERLSKVELTAEL